LEWLKQTSQSLGPNLDAFLIHLYMKTAVDTLFVHGEHIWTDGDSGLTEGYVSGVDKSSMGGILDLVLARDVITANMYTQPIIVDVSKLLLVFR
jgi:hypothetical protein